MKKGFTLVELLAVIVILGLLALITTPIVVNILDSSKKETDEVSVQNYITAVNEYLLLEDINNKPIADGIYKIVNKGNICLDTNCTKILEIPLDGEKPISGSIIIQNNKVKNIFSLNYNKFIANFNNENIVITLKGKNETPDDNTGSGSDETLYTGTIYRNSTVSLSIGDSLESKRWCVDISGIINSCSNDMLQLGFSSKEKCESALQEVPSKYAFLVKNAKCEQETETYIHKYETDLKNINQPYYLKHDVVNNIVTASYACITYTENKIRKDVCVRGGNSANYLSNQGILRSVESYFNTLDYNSDSNNYKGLCTFTDNRSRCLSDSINLYARNDGNVRSYKDTHICRVDTDGSSICYDENEIPIDI